MMVLVKFTLFNRKTHSVIGGELRFKGASFHDIVDDLPRRIRNRMRDWFKANFAGEDLHDWTSCEVLGYQPFELWAERVERATGNRPKKSKLIKKKGNTQ